MSCFAPIALYRGTISALVMDEVHAESMQSKKYPEHAGRRPTVHRHRYRGLSKVFYYSPY